jgi:hypothetical protein
LGWSRAECGAEVSAGRLVRVSGRPSPVFGVADRFVRRWAELEPTQGLIYGLAGTPGRLSDWSPEGRARVAEALRRGLAASLTWRVGVALAARPARIAVGGAD